MRRIALLALVLAVVLVPSTAAAQEATPSPTAGNDSAAQEGERIDGNTELLNASYDSETGMISTTIRSETLQQITLTDAGAFMTGGEVEQRSVTLRPDETATVRIPATEYEGFVGVSIATSSTLYAVPIEVSDPWFKGQPTWETTRIVGGGSIVGVLLIAGYLARKRLKGGKGEVDRIA